MRGTERKEVQQTTWIDRRPSRNVDLVISRDSIQVIEEEKWIKNAKRRSAAADGGNGAAAPKRLRAIRFRRLRRLRAPSVLGAISRPPASQEHSQASIASASAAFQKGEPKALWQWLCHP